MDIRITEIYIDFENAGVVLILWKYVILLSCNLNDDYIFNLMNNFSGISFIANIMALQIDFT